MNKVYAPASRLLNAKFPDLSVITILVLLLSFCKVSLMVAAESEDLSALSLSLPFKVIDWPWAKAEKRVQINKIEINRNIGFVLYAGLDDTGG